MYKSVTKSITEAYTAEMRASQGLGGWPDSDLKIARMIEYGMIIAAVERKQHTRALVQLCFGVHELIKKDDLDWMLLYAWSVFFNRCPKDRLQEKTFLDMKNMFETYVLPCFLSQYTNQKKPMLKAVCEKYQIDVIEASQKRWKERRAIMEGALRDVLSEGLDEPARVVRMLQDRYECFA